MVQSIKIVLADDDQEDQILVTDALRSIGTPQVYKYFDNGIHVLQYLESVTDDKLPSLIVLDFNMPVINGLETLTHIKSKQRFTHIPIIIFSTSDYDRDKQRCYEAGATQFIKKPLDFGSYKHVAHEFSKYVQPEMSGR